MAFKLKPCCSFIPLEAGLKWLSIAQLICSFIILALGIYSIIYGSRTFWHWEIYSLYINLGVFLVAMSFGYFGLAILLWKAAIQRKEKYCRICLTTVVILCIIGIIGLVSSIFPPEVTIVPFALWLVLQPYFIWVVVVFRNEILGQSLIEDGQGTTTGLVEQGTTTRAKYTAESHP